MPRANSTRILIVVLLILAVAFGYNYFFKPFAKTEELVSEDQIQQPVVPEEKVDIDGLLAAMSGRQKLSQLLAFPINLSVESQVSTSTTSASPSASTDYLAKLSENKPGFILIFGESLPAESTQARIRTLKTTAQLVLPLEELPQIISPAIAVDHEGGSVQRLSGEGFTTLPSWQDLCDYELASRAALLRQSSLELKSAGINIVLAPVADVSDNNRILADRICTEDVASASSRVMEFVALFDIAEITPVLKHFPGLGQTTTDLHFGYQSINPDQSELNVFRAVVDGYPNIGIMSSFVGVTAQNPRLPCALSPDCVGQLTTEYPSALLFTDALEMVAAGYQAGSASATLSERSERAIKAGNHVLIFGDSVSGDDFSEILDDLENLLVTDPEFATLVEKQAKHVLEYKQTKGLL